MLVIDGLGIYTSQKISVNYVLLRESPSINLDCLFKTLNPELIIANASNYKSHILQWQKTSQILNIKFHYTVKDGVYIEKL